MSSVFDRCLKMGLLNTPPYFMENNVQLEVMMGSVAYGVSNDSSDMDIYGVVMQPKDWSFPHLRGEIPGFSTHGQTFQTWQQHHIEDKEARKEYDLCFYSLERFFRLCMENNPNMIDALFVPRRCVLFSTPMAERIRESRQMFLHKGSWHKFKGYAYSQLHKMRTKKPEGKRIATVEEFGYDVKFAYHVVRLLDEIEQILTTQDLDITRSREVLKAIRRGDWPIEKVSNYFEEKEKDLERLYQTSTLPHSPDEEKLRDLLLECMESHYGSLDAAISVTGKEQKALQDIAAIASKFNR